MKKIIDDSRRVYNDSGTLEQMINQLTEAVNSLPEDQRASATFELRKENDYDYEYAALFMNFRRPETNVEEAARETNEAEQKAYQEERERKEFERLSKKFAK